MRKMALAVFVIVCFLTVIFLREEVNERDMLPTEKFIRKWLMNANGTLAANIQDGNHYDADLVRGREALSESLGLWMAYALQKQDQKLFEENYDILLSNYIVNGGFVSWKLSHSGEREVTTNALVDDLRIIRVFYQAADVWDRPEFGRTADRISHMIGVSNQNRGFLVDYYDYRDESLSETLTLSYIDPIALSEMVDRGQLDQRVFRNMTTLLSDLPTRHGFYPKSYHVEKKSFRFESAVNLIDQTLIALHRARAGVMSPEYLAFIQQEFSRRGLIYGSYDIETQTPSVSYESPAVYGLIIMYLLEVGERPMACAVYDRMKTLQTTDLRDPFYGGYMSTPDDTHIFDNLLPLLAEVKMKNR